MSEEGQPRPPGAMPQEQIDKIAERLNGCITDSGACKACNHGKYSIAPHMVTPPVVYEGNLMIGGPSYPQVMLVCDRCGHTRFHNAVALGIIGNTNE